MQATSHKEHVFETGHHPQSPQVQTQKSRSCRLNQNNHHHQLLKPSQNSAPTALSSVPIVTSQIAFSSSPHIVENRGHGQGYVASRTTRIEPADKSTISVSEEPNSIRLPACKSQQHGYNSSRPISSSIPQPVIVRTYTPAESRASSIALLSSPPPLVPTPALLSSASLLNLKSTLSSLRGRVSAPSFILRPSIASTSSTHRRSQHYQQEILSSPAAAAIRSAMVENSHLPPIDAFTFKNVLRSVEPDIQSALDAIAEICSRSKLSLADEYSAHLPPQGEISTSLYSTHPYRVAGGNGIGAAAVTTMGQDSALSVVPEASSSSERLAGQEQRTSESFKTRDIQEKKSSKSNYATTDCTLPPRLNSDKITPPKAATKWFNTNEATVSGIIDLPNFTQSVASPMKETEEYSKRRSSITLLSSSTSEGTNPTAPTTTAVANVVSPSGDAAAVSRRPTVADHDLIDSSKPKSNFASWAFWSSSNHKRESERGTERPGFRAEAKLNDILKGTGTVVNNSVSTKK